MLNSFEATTLISRALALVVGLLFCYSEHYLRSSEWKHSFNIFYEFWSESFRIHRRNWRNVSFMKYTAVDLLGSGIEPHICLRSTTYSCLQMVLVFNYLSLIHHYICLHKIPSHHHAMVSRIIHWITIYHFTWCGYIL